MKDLDEFIRKSESGESIDAKDINRLLVSLGGKPIAKNRSGDMFRYVMYAIVLVAKNKKALN